MKQWGCLGLNRLLLCLLLSVKFPVDAVTPETTGTLNTIDRLWDFRDGLQDWARSTMEEMNADVYVSKDGELRGTVLGPEPYIDAPPMLLSSTDRHYCVLRFIYLGGCDTAKLLLETGSELPLPGQTPFPKESTSEIIFSIIPDGEYHTYYVPIWKKLSGTITRLRVHPAIKGRHTTPPRRGHTFSFEWILIAKAPVVHKVRGCIDQYFKTSNLVDPIPSLTQELVKTNGFHESYNTKYHPSDFPYAKTYNCLRRGGEKITIFGRNLGKSDAIVLIDGKNCLDVVHTIPETEIQCKLPAGTKSPAKVTVKNGQYNGLYEDLLSLSFAAPTPAIPLPIISNVAAHAIDLSWYPPTPFWLALVVTGYQIMWKEVADPIFSNTLYVGNVTTTTIVGLKANVQYEFKVATMNEDQVTSQEWKQIDLYGRRHPIGEVLIGAFSPTTAAVTTLRQDFRFDRFDANATLSHGPFFRVQTTGPTGELGGQGHYGLTVVGDANIQNCNTSVVCCDHFETACTLTCSGIFKRSVTHVSGSSDDRKVRSNLFGYDPSQRIVVDIPANIAVPATASCGPALRLTGSHAALAGASWYPRQMNVREGFETQFTFQITNPSTHCKFMDDVYTNCRSRGGDGFAFVIQNQSPVALGKGGMELAFGGIKNSIAVEFDTSYNYELLEPYENHISVQTRGWREDNSANHSFSLGSTSRILDLTEGMHTVRIKYSPIFDEEALFSESFDASPHATYFLSNADFVNGGQADWSTGMGTMSIYLNDLLAPVLVVPLNIDDTMELNHGRAWVGFTASTGEKSWQVHDIFSWTFSSLRVEPPNTAPVLVNGVGAHECKDENVCVHR